MYNMYKFFALTLTALTLSGCASTQVADPVTLPLEAVRGFDDGLDARLMTILRGDGNGTISFDAMINDLIDADVILVGEMHNHTESLDFIATTFESLIEKNDNLVLSMEFYERDEQLHLDDYLGGITDYAQFVKASGRNSGNNPIGHLRMIELSKEHHRAVIASNAPRRYTKLARTGGFEALHELNTLQQSMLTIPSDLPTGGYADRFRDAMSGMAAHGGDEMINGFLRSQTVWDQTMAQSVANQVNQRGASVFHVAGHFHVDHATTHGGSAMTDAIRARIDPNSTVRSIVVHESESDSLTDEDAGLDGSGPAADYIVYFKPAPE